MRVGALGAFGVVCRAMFARLCLQVRICETVFVSPCLQAVFASPYKSPMPKTRERGGCGAGQKDLHIVGGAAWRLALRKRLSALDLNTVTPPPAKPQQKPDWAGFYFKNNSGGSDPWTVLTPSTGFAAQTTTAAPRPAKISATISSRAMSSSASKARWRRQISTANSPRLICRRPTAGGWTPNMNWLGTVTGRVGYSVGQWLPYVKGGFAAAEVGSPLQGAGQIGSFTQGDHDGGWTAGVGFEYQFSPKWSLGLEYLYTDLGAGAPNGARVAGGRRCPARRKCIRPRSRARACWAGSTTRPAGS